MTVERHPGSLRALSDDHLGTVAVSVVVAELQWIPDVAPAVMERISRDAVAYPEQFDRRPLTRAPYVPPAPSGRSTRRTLTRIAVFAVILVIIIGLVLFAATASVAAAGASLPIGEIDGTLGVLHVVTEAP